MDKDRFLGAILGLAAGDALGTTLEFSPPGTFTPITDMVGGGPFSLAPGQWTDDTSMAFCLGVSLLTQKGFDPEDQMERYYAWWRDGYLSSTGECFDIGGTTSSALRHFEKTGDPFSGDVVAKRSEYTAGNGSIMRLAPVPMFYARSSANEVIHYCGESSRTTHGNALAVDACKALGYMIYCALHGYDKEILLDPNLYPGIVYGEVEEVIQGSYKRFNPPNILGTGFVVDTLEAALWAFYNTESFEEGALAVVNLGDDADTTGAVYGQLAGAFYGVEGIPLGWRKKLALRSNLEALASGLYHAAEGGKNG